MSVRTFPLDVVLSVTTGRLLCDMAGVYEILNHVTGESLFTHQLPRACRFAEPLIKSAWPELRLADTALPQLNALIEEAKKKGEKAIVGCRLWLVLLRDIGLRSDYEIQSADNWRSFNPLAELVSMVGKENVIVVQPKEAK